MSGVPMKESGGPGPVRRADVGMAWAVRESFVRYIRRLPGGQVWLDGGAAATSTGEFYFPFVAAELTGTSRFTLHFAGEVGFSAHMGMLSLRVRNPRIEFERGRGTLSIGQDAGRVELGEIQLPDRATGGGVTTWAAAPVALAENGAPLFGGTYQAGEEMAPLTIRVPSSCLQPAGGAPGAR